MRKRIAILFAVLAIIGAAVAGASGSGAFHSDSGSTIIAGPHEGGEI